MGGPGTQPRAAAAAMQHPEGSGGHARPLPLGDLIKGGQHIDAPLLRRPRANNDVIW